MKKDPSAFLQTSIECRQLVEDQNQKATTTKTCKTKSCSSKGTPGFQPSVWGPGLWLFLHVMSLNYPENPTEADKERHYNFLFSLSDMLPCKQCQEHFKGYLRKCLSTTDLDSRSTFFKWMHKFHDAVNERLGKGKWHSSEDASRWYKQFQVNNDKKYSAFINFRELHSS
jgi:Erv1 / Alr family